MDAATSAAEAEQYHRHSLQNTRGQTKKTVTKLKPGAKSKTPLTNLEDNRNREHSANQETIQKHVATRDHLRRQQ